MRKRWVSSTPFNIPFHLPVHSRIEALVSSSFANVNQKYFSIIPTSFQNLFVVLLREKECSFNTLTSFIVLKLDECLSFQLPFVLPV